MSDQAERRRVGMDMEDIVLRWRSGVVEQDAGGLFWPGDTKIAAYALISILRRIPKNLDNRLGQVISLLSQIARSCEARPPKRSGLAANMRLAWMRTVGFELPEGLTLDSHYNELRFSVRARKAINRAGCKTIGELTNMSAERLMEMPNFGAASLQEVRGKLAAIGLSLREDVEPASSEKVKGVLEAIGRAIREDNAPAGGATSP